VSHLIARSRVFVIDAERIVADTLAEILNLHGYEAKAHYCGESALSDAKMFRPQVILSDVRMEKIDRIETALKLRDCLPGCRIILCTASPLRPEIYRRIDDLGFESLERPLHPWNVLTRLRAGHSHQGANAVSNLRKPWSRIPNLTGIGKSGRELVRVHYCDTVKTPDVRTF
jgi:DNA-binding NtrC family response regulator